MILIRLYFYNSRLTGIFIQCKDIFLSLELAIQLSLRKSKIEILLRVICELLDILFRIINRLNIFDAVLITVELFNRLCVNSIPEILLKILIA